MFFTIARAAARPLLWVTALLLLLGACVPPDTSDALPTATPVPTTDAAAPPDAAPAEAVTATTAVTEAVAPTVSSNLMLTTPVTVEITTPISPGQSIIGPVGEPQMHTMPAAPASHSTDHAAHMAQSDVPVDLAFIDEMTEHHQGALDMAQALLLNTDRPELVEMANAILATQTAEIEQMQAWRAAWYPDAPLSAGDAMGMSMGDMVVSDDASIPYDQRFLQAMIPHHSGAVAMAQMVLEQGERAEIKQLAQAIISAQEAEIVQMQAWLQEWYGE